MASVTLRVLRVYHGGRDASQRARDRALKAAGVEVVLIVPSAWPGDELDICDPELAVLELPVDRAGDVNRHRYKNPAGLNRLFSDIDPDVLDIHEEPFSVATSQLLMAAPTGLPTVLYTAQNIDKRFPPPFCSYERRAYRRAAALYPCSRQAAAVARGKGFTGLIDVLPLGYDPEIYMVGRQSLMDDDLRLGFVGRLVPEKGVWDALRVLAYLHKIRPTRLVAVGGGPEEAALRQLAAMLGVADRFDLVPWLAATELAEMYRQMHVVLVPSMATPTWAEQFGRVIVEAQASGAVVAGYASGAIPEVAGAPAILVSERAVEDLARCVAALVSDEDAYQERREGGLALARSRTWASIAERQANLYRRAQARGGAATSVSRPLPALCRAAARAEFGRTAPTPAGDRPFALPLLRRGGMAADLLARVIDAGASLRARL
jgi:glycosyltransferase involved in cell wall biosynthesis